METVLSMINRLGGGLLFLVLGAFSVLGTSAAAQAERYYQPSGLIQMDVNTGSWMTAQRVI
jgi:hypothetical protein